MAGTGAPPTSQALFAAPGSSCPPRHGRSLTSTTTAGGDTMTAFLGNACNGWLVVALLVLVLGLAGALLAATRSQTLRPHPLGCRPPPMRQAGRMRFATWNVNSVKARLPRLLEWLADTAPDVVCLQETKVADDGFPAGEVAELGYEVAALRPGPVERRGRCSPGSAWTTCGAASPASPAIPTRRRARSAPGAPASGSCRCTCRTGAPRTIRTTRTSWPGSPRCATRWRPTSRPGPLVVAGDFNVAPTDADVWDPRVFIGVDPRHAARARRAGRDPGRWA